MIDEIIDGIIVALTFIFVALYYIASFVFIIIICLLPIVIIGAVILIAIILILSLIGGLCGFDFITYIGGLF